MPETRYIAGAMSGTSADGVDIAITAITGRGLDMSAKLIHHHHRPYNAELRKAIFAFRGGDVASTGSTDFLAKLAQLGREISLTYATATNEALAASQMTASQLAAVAAHGQTLYHGPPNTIQWFDPSLVAAEVGCPVVSDFRRADLAAGGQGAPLVPFADYILFRHATETRVLLNIGGIANFTYIPAGATLEQVIAFDTGPGNCISDYLCRKFDPDGPGYDVNGARAMRGKSNEELTAHVLSKPYFSAPSPKSTDGPAMIDAFEQSLRDLELKGYLTFEDLLATAATITAGSILMEIARQAEPNAIIASGGGCQNVAIRRALVDSTPFRLLDEFGVTTDAKEAIAFALLAAATLDGVPSNVPSVTGAKRAVVLGSITPKP